MKILTKTQQNIQVLHMSHEKKTRPDTPPKFNMEPENDGFQKESPFPGTSFQVPCQISGVYFLLKY